MGVVERQLRKVGDQLRALREELAVAEEQHAHFAEVAEEARLRALVSETPGSEQENRDAQRHADAFARRRDDFRAEIARLERSQDDLLDQLSAERG